MPTKLGYEPTGVDFVVDSTPLTPEEKQAFSQLIAEQRQQRPRPPRRSTATPAN
ncbi:hypothetical protein [Hymenobacter sp. UV11]|uniref:hypothetical protein n=1 Tax=Hymenobacter sp. UV11 TaxID=1849735 RepID=UPI001414D70B|nr:hypothetical protein [Hymenobacter sp. UV11]